MFRRWFCSKPKELSDAKIEQALKRLRQRLRAYKKHFSKTITKKAYDEQDRRTAIKKSALITSLHQLLSSHEYYEQLFDTKDSAIHRDTYQHIDRVLECAADALKQRKEPTQEINAWWTEDTSSSSDFKKQLLKAIFLDEQALFKNEFETNLDKLVQIEHQEKLLNAIQASDEKKEQLQAEKKTILTELAWQIEKNVNGNRVLREAVLAYTETVPDVSLADSIKNVLPSIQNIYTAMRGAPLKAMLKKYHLTEQNDPNREEKFYERFSNTLKESVALTTLLEELPNTADELLAFIDLRRGKKRDNRFIKWLEKHFPTWTKRLSIAGHRAVVAPIEEMRKNGNTKRQR